MSGRANFDFLQNHHFCLLESFFLGKNTPATFQIMALQDFEIHNKI